MSRFEGRRRAAIAALDAEPSAMFVTKDPATVRYLTGFSGSNGLVLLDKRTCTLVTDGRYRDQATHEATDVDIVIERDGLSAVVSRLSRESGGRRPTLLVDPMLAAGDVARLRRDGLEVSTAGPAVQAIRQVKDRDELASLELACTITARALQQVAGEIRVGMSEISIARRLETIFAEMGADDRAFATIVATGTSSAIPHHRPTTAPVRAGDLLVIDCGALVDGYHADMTRTFVVGVEPQGWQVEIHAVVMAAQAAGRQAARAGVMGRDVDAAARAVIQAAGHADAFTHGTGHGVGLQIHEAPMISSTTADSLIAGTVMTVEPGIYLPGRGGVRIEDTIVVGDTARVLTEAPRELITVG